MECKEQVVEVDGRVFAITVDVRGIQLKASSLTVIKDPVIEEESLLTISSRVLGRGERELYDVFEGT